MGYVIADAVIGDDIFDGAHLVNVVERYLQLDEQHCCIGSCCDEYIDSAEGNFIGDGHEDSVGHAVQADDERTGAVELTLTCRRLQGGWRAAAS